MSEDSPENENVNGGTGITAGHDVSIGDVTGQLAIGEYINQFMIKEPSGKALIELIAYLEQKRREEANLKTLNSYSPSALPDYPPKLKEFVTTNRVEELNKALMYLQDHRILLFTGIGGVGKTTLARALIDIRPANVPIPFWFDFRLNQSSKLGDILEKLAAYMNSPDIAKFREEKREPEKKDIDKLTDKLHAGNSLWLVFDNLETILDDIYFHDEHMDLFFTCLRNSTHQARIIITSRIFPKLKDGEYLVDLTEGQKQDVKGLKTNFAVDYLVKNGFDDIEPYKLEKLSKGVDGHSLALKLLVELVKEFGEEDILEDLSIYQEQRQGTILKARKLFDKLVGNEKGLLERISVYREPVGLKGLKEMFMKKNSLNDIKKLMNKSLLETDLIGNYWLHPLVQEFAYEDLENKIETHKIACKYYLSLPLPKILTKKEDVQFLIEAHHHACMAKEYNEAFHIIIDNNLSGKLSLWGNYTVLVDLYSKMLPEDHFKDEKFLENKGDYGVILGNLGGAYLFLGEFTIAIEYFERVLEIFKEIGDRQGEGDSLGSIGDAYRDLGEPRKAIEYYEQALEIFKKIGDSRGEGRWLLGLGCAYRDLGEPRKAIEYYGQALEIAKKEGNRSEEGNCLGNMGTAYNDLGELRKAIKYIEQALEIARKEGNRSDEGLWLGNLGEGYNKLGESRKAIKYIENSLKIAKEVGNKSYEGFWIGTLGSIYHNLGEPRKAIEHYEQALRIATEIEDRVREGVWLGNIGNAYRDLGEPSKAIEYSEQALKISGETGDRDGEVDQLGCMGNAYCDLDEFTKAVKCCDQALKISKEIGYRHGEADQLVNLGSAYRDLDPIKAIEYFERALKISKEIGYRRVEGNSLKNLGKAYSNLGESKKAIDYYEQALSIGKEIENLEIVKFCEKNLETLKSPKK